MKFVTIAFLFFYSSNFSVCGLNGTFQEQKVDSLRYYYNLANNPKESTDLPKAYKFYSILKEKNLINQDTLQAVQNLRQIAIMQNNWGDYYASESSVVEALKLLDNFRVNDSTIIESKVGLYNQVGRINHALLRYNSAIEFFNKGLDIAISQEHINTLKNNKALVYRDQEKYVLAESEFKEVYQSNLNSKDKNLTARILNNLGHVRAKLNNPLALNNLLDALQIRLKNNDVSGSYSSYKNLSIYYSKVNSQEEAQNYADKALAVAREINHSSYIEDALTLVLTFSTDKNVLMYTELKDSLGVANQIQENKNALMKYNIEEERSKTQESKLEKEVAQRKNLMAQGIAAFIILLSTFLYFILKSKYRKEKLQEVYNTEARISKKVHDEVANDVYQVMTKVQSRANESDEVLDDLEHIYIKTRDISKDNSAIDFNTDFDETLNNLLLNYRNDNVGVITKGLTKINWSSISNIEKMTIYRVLQELMTNMKKHSNASVVAITFSKTNNKIQINYKDNGIGCNIKKQVGLQNTETRMASINGTITFDSQPNKGFNAKIVV